MESSIDIRSRLTRIYGSCATSNRGISVIMQASGHNKMTVKAEGSGAQQTSESFGFNEAGMLGSDLM